MGCGLRKMKLASEESSPGKIYSTLKRPQVETKVGVAYTYRYLDFLIGKDGGTSTLHLSSVRELPGQLQELYQQGFVLATVHPFIHPCGPESNSLQHRLYRAILLRLTDGAERSQSVCAPCKLQLEDCLSAELVPTPELIQGYVKKQIQDAADQGVLFVGFVQEPYGAPCSRIREPDTPSVSLHSSPTSVLRSLSISSHSSPSSPINHAEAGEKQDVDLCEVGALDGEKPPTGNPGNYSGSELGGSLGGVSPAASPVSEEQNKDATEDELPPHNNNKDREESSGRRRARGAELLALYNHPPVRDAHMKYYTVKVPLQVQNCNNGVKGVEANWLDHMTQHFNNGASLVDGYFHLGNVSDTMPKSVESVFIFQERSEGELNVATPTYDAIVVEQWTIIHGLQVKADYVPLLQSLATFGWRLTCVLPTPVIKTNSDGSVATKQIVFLQRPILDRKRRDSKKLIFKPRSKSNKNCNNEATKTKKKKTKKDNNEEDPTISGREKAASKQANATTVEAARESERSLQCEQGHGEDDLHSETAGQKDAAQEVPEQEEEEEKTTVDGQASPEPVGTADTAESGATTVETQSKSKYTEDQGQAEADGVIENAMEMDEEEDKDEDHGVECTGGEPAAVEVCSKEITVESSAQSPEETQESV